MIFFIIAVVIVMMIFEGWITPILFFKITLRRKITENI
jgi:hypothetical protein